jgi:hypothetical protein
LWNKKSNCPHKNAMHVSIYCNIHITVLNNVRENRRGNQEWTIHRNWQHWVHKTQNEDKQSKNTTLKTTKTSNTDTTKNMGWNQGLTRGKQFLLLIRHPSCNSHSQDMLNTTIGKQTQMKNTISVLAEVS